MKQLVAELPKNLTTPDDAYDGKYYGVEESKRRGFISRENFGRDNFIVFSANSITKGNDWDSYRNSKCLKTVIKRLMGGGFQVFEFDTFQELFEWVSKGESDI